MTKTKTSSEDRKRYQVLTRMLMDRQTEIRTKLRSLREVLPAEVAQVKDAEEQSMEDFVLGMDFAVMEMESETLRQIDEAIQRLEDDEAVRNARPSRFFEDGPAPAARERRNEKPAKFVSPVRVPAAPAPVEARAIRAGKPARASRA
jgi:hypothetical protein